MNKEIEIGEYVRTKRGDINKVIGIREELRDGKRIYGHKAYYLDTRKGSLTKAFIIKHSKNIIDLIEVGDYVNGEKVVGRDNQYVMILSDNAQTFLQTLFENKQIKSVVTKEEFERIEYKVD